MSNIPASIENEKSMSWQHMEDVDMIVGAIANKNNLKWISLFKKMKEYLIYSKTDINTILADGLHPNDDGYNIMYYLILESLGFTLPIDGYTWTPKKIG